MNITFMSQTTYQKNYGIFCSAVPARNQREALYPTFCKIPAGGASLPHAHFEPEIFFIIKGLGEMTIDDETQLVSAGDLIRIPAHSRHTLKNSEDSTLEFLSIYSEDIEIPNPPSSVLVTAAPPTPNGPLHLGHISGPYLASDILARFLRNQSNKVITHSGTDDHQNYVSEKALIQNNNVDVFHRRQRDRILRGLQSLNIKYDEFIEPKSDHKYQFKILNFAQRAIRSGVIEKENLAMPHCFDCDLTLVDALIDGQCPQCHSSSRGGCEACGIVVPPFALLNPICSRCHQPAQIKRMDVYTFNLSKYLPLIKVDLEKLKVTDRIRVLISQIQAQSDFKVLVSHPSNSQLGLKIPETSDTLHVWFEMAAHYEAHALSSSHWVHFFGFDNSFHYLLFIPALLRALNPQSKMPETVVSNEFLLLDGAKFSTSRGHAIWADEFSGNTDFLRLYLALNRPAEQETDFSLNDFENFSKRLENQIRALRTRLQNSSVTNSLACSKEVSQETLLNTQRFTRDFNDTMSLSKINLRQAGLRLLSYLDHLTHSAANQIDDAYRIQVFASQLSAFMPDTAASLLPLENKEMNTYENL